MKRIAVILTVAALVISLVGCMVEPHLLETEPVTTSTVTDTIESSSESSVPPTVPTEPSEPETVPTEPPTEPSRPVPEPEDDDFVRILDYVPNALQSLPYASNDNFTGQVIYEFSDAYLRYGAVKKLAAAATELEAMGFGLLIWDGYRPVYAQAKLYDVCPDPTYVSPPGVGSQTHCRGRAVDLTLYDLDTGEVLEMPTDFDDFSALADRNYSDVSVEAAANARVLEDVMTKHGFKGYSAEWWHYTDTDNYPIEEEFDPAKVA